MRRRTYVVDNHAYTRSYWRALVCIVKWDLCYNLPAWIKWRFRRPRIHRFTREEILRIWHASIDSAREAGRQEADGHTV